MDLEGVAERERMMRRRKLRSIKDAERTGEALLHLRIHEASDIVTAVWPLELAIALDLRVFKVAAIDVGFLSFYRFVREIRLLVILDAFPLFVTFTIH